MAQDEKPGDFSSIPILDWSLLSTPEGKSKFIGELQHALVNVGFLYLSNPPVAREVMDKLIEYTPRLFDLPQEEKESIRMTNSPHFFGYTGVGAEITKGKTDQREQFDFGTPYECKWKPGDPDYIRLWGPSQVCLIVNAKQTIRINRLLLHASSGPRKSWFQASKISISAT